MVLKSLSFISFNCTGFKLRNYDYLKCLYNNSQVLFIQETWLFNSQHKNINNLFKGCQYHAVSAMADDDVGRVGRPYGGCAIVWHGDLALSCRPVPTTSKRVCAVTAEAPGRAMLWLTVYMPVNDNTNTSYNNYGEVLAEV